MSLTELSIKRPVTTVMLFVSLLAVGLIAAVRLPLEALPEVAPPFIFVQLPYAGSTPEEVERTLLKPVEEALSTLSGVKRMDSSARADGASVFVQLDDWSRDVAIAASDARERIDAIRGQLPADFQRYSVLKFSTSDQPVLRVRLSSAQRDLTRAYDLLQRQFVRPLERIPGVARVELTGAPPNEIEVAINPERLAAYDISLDQLAARLKQANFAVSAGTITDQGRRLRVQPQGQLDDLQQLRDLPINARGARLSDIADVHLRAARMDYGRRLDGRPAIGLDIFKERSANLVDVSRAAMAKIEQIRRDPAMQGIQIKVIDDLGANVTRSLKDLAEAGAIGLLLSVAVLFFFLRHWPSTLMVTLAIPICFVMTLGFMYFAGVTLNVLSMMGLLLAVGMMVDNAVVVVESIYQERERMSGQPRRAALLGTRNVAIALSAGTLSHCIVFVPNLFGERNFLGIYLAQIAITISVSLLASWLVAVSLIPMLSARMATPKLVSDPNGLIARLQRRYARVLHWTLQHRGLSLLGIAAIVLLSFIPVLGTKTDMFGGQEPGKTQISYQWKGSYTKEQMAREIARVEQYIDANRARLHIQQVYSWYSENEGSVTMVTFDPQYAKRSQQLAAALGKGLPKSAIAEIGIGRPDGGPGDGGPGSNLQVRLIGDSTAQLESIAHSIMPLLERTPQLRDVHLAGGDRGSELLVRVDRQRAAAYGFSVQEVSNFVALALRGTPLREFQRNDTEVPVWVRFAGAERYDINDLGGFNVRTRDGRSVPLLALVNVDLRPAAAEISRSNRQTSVAITAALAGKTTVPEARQAMESVLKSVAFPPGYGYSFEGSAFGDEDEAMQRMLFNLLIALIMIYVVMAAVFESLLFPAAIMSGVLFSVFGVYWLFWLTGTTFSIMAFIGILVLMGVVVNNGIVMIEHINTLRRRGMGRTEALVAGSRERLRPILMTMGTAILAMVPIALGQTQIGGDGPPYYPMARAIAGGLAFSTVVTLLFLPTIYAVLDDLRTATTRIFMRARQPRAVPTTGGSP